MYAQWGMRLVVVRGTPVGNRGWRAESKAPCCSSPLMKIHSQVPASAGSNRTLERTAKTSRTH